jgi:hypothetical protein
MTQAPIDWVNIRNALWSWLGESTGIDVVWGDQPAREPAYPYGVLKIISGPEIVGRDFMHKRYQASAEAGAELKLDLNGWRYFTLSCHVYSDSSDPERNAIHYMSIAQAALAFPQWVERFADTKLAVRRIEAVNDLSALDGDAIESHAQMDLFLSTVAHVRAANSTTYIESMEAPTDLTTE